VGTWDWQVKANRIVADSAVGALFGVDPARAEQGAPVADYVAGIHPGDRERVQAAIRKACRAGSTGEYSVEYRVTGIDGVLRWVLARGRCYHDDAGKPVRFPGVVVDITARKESEERQALLAREVDHRAKNVLAVAQSVVWLTRTEDPHAFREAVTGRITAMARAHTLLASENWTGARLRMLVEAELAAHRRVESDPTPERVTLTGARVDILPVAVQPLAMTLHELTTNAVKHGALSVIGGRLDVTWMPAEAGALRLQWAERGGPRLTGEPGRRGFGTSLVETTVNRQLGGRLRLDWSVEGLTVDVTLPATRVRWHGAPPTT
jgi:PAS domain S-box-containing protein